VRFDNANRYFHFFSPR